MPPRKGSDRKSMVFGDGPLKRAVIVCVNPDGKKTEIPVQFNPNHYSISRGVSTTIAKGSADNPKPDDMKAVDVSLATLNLELVIDGEPDLERGGKNNLTKYFDNEDITKYIQTLAMMLKYDFKVHNTAFVVFGWGSLHFKGIVTSMNVKYELFNRNGKPVRASVSLSMQGEETAIINKQVSSPFESPDRTKYRAIGQADELWMLAYQEYSDPFEWRAIAKENGILNPRKIDYTKVLKVPSL